MKSRVQENESSPVSGRMKNRRMEIRTVSIRIMNFLVCRNVKSKKRNSNRIKKEISPRMEAIVIRMILKIMPEVVDEEILYNTNVKLTIIKMSKRMYWYSGLSKGKRAIKKPNGPKAEI